MHQYWFFIGDFPIRAYGTMVALAFIIGVGVTIFFSKNKDGFLAMFFFFTLFFIILVDCS
jgi:phosphatidylglycerol:prolipoprotein diacylglycerol transferase